MQKGLALLALAMAGCATTEVVPTDSDANASEACSEAYQSESATTSLEACRQSAKSGVSGAEYGYGLILWSGQGRQTQPKEAIEWFRRAAKHGNRLARVVLGRFLTDDQVPREIRNLAEGYAWWLVGGEQDAAAELKHRLSPAELSTGEKLAKEFATKYGAYRAAQ
jgi:TPR repeat protein